MLRTISKQASIFIKQSCSNILNKPICFPFFYEHIKLSIGHQIPLTGCGAGAATCTEPGLLKRTKRITSEHNRKHNNSILVNRVSWCYSQGAPRWQGGKLEQRIFIRKAIKRGKMQILNIELSGVGFHRIYRKSKIQSQSLILEHQCSVHTKQMQVGSSTLILPNTNLHIITKGGVRNLNWEFELKENNNAFDFLVCCKSDNSIFWHIGEFTIAHNHQYLLGKLQKLYGLLGNIYTTQEQKKAGQKQKQTFSQAITTMQNTYGDKKILIQDFYAFYSNINQGDSQIQGVLVLKGHQDISKFTINEVIWRNVQKKSIEMLAILCVLRARGVKIHRIVIP